MKVLQINTKVNAGSTGRIAEEIGTLLIKNHHQSYIGFGRGKNNSVSQTLRIGDRVDIVSHGLQTIIFDEHGLGSFNATKVFIEKVKSIKPDIIHLHNIHGYFLHYGVLGKFLLEYNRPVVWTLHDAWSFTGHCTYFDNIECERWKTGCYSCPKKKNYPTSFFLDRSKQNYLDKKTLFTGIENLNIVTPSFWLASLVKQSFFKEKPLHVIPNGVNLEVFSPNSELLDLERFPNIIGKRVILGVASVWDPRKGLNDFRKLSELLSDDYIIVLIGLNQKQINSLPRKIFGLRRTDNTGQLASWYAHAEVFINPTWQDNFPTTNIEALACGTPIITYRTGGSPEAIDAETGRIVEKGDIKGLVEAINSLSLCCRSELRDRCRERAITFFNKENRYLDYLNLYNSLLRV